MSFNKTIESPGRAQTPLEELEFLQQRIAQLQERLGATDPTQYEKEQMVSKEISAYKQEDKETILAPELHMNDKEVVQASAEITEESDRQMDELVDMLIQKGIRNTLDVVDEMGQPHLTDEFHRFLTQYLAEGMDVQGLKEGTPLFKALHMTLFEVTLPFVSDSEKDYVRLVTAMEQFYMGMLSIGDTSKTQGYFSIEIAVSNKQEHVVFYVSVPNTKISLFEKQMIATFPRAHITKVQGDYNPFNKDGFSAGSILRLRRPAVLPLKTFGDTDQDPLSVLLASFAKLKNQGEGATIQLIVSPAQNIINNEYKEVLKQVRSGVSLNRAMEGAAMKVAREIFGALMDKGTNKENEESPDVDEELVRAITEKIASPIVEANIRIVSSAETQERADEILSDLEASFHQFANEPLNAVDFRRVSKKGLQSLLHDFSFRLYTEKNAVRLNLKELTSMLHFPVTEGVSADLKRAHMVSAAAPSNMDAEGVFLGKNVHQGEAKDVYIAAEDRMRHFYVIGQTGTGKTTLIKNMIMQDIMNGEGVCYIDPHGTDIEDILNSIPEHRKQDVIYFDPSDVARPLGLNMLEYDPTHPEQKTFVINELFSIFKKLYANSPESMGPMFEQYFRNATALVVEDPETGNTLLDVSRVLSDQKFREMKLQRCKNPIVVQFWKEIASKAGGDASLANMVPYITNKFDVFLSNDIMRTIVSQEKSSFTFRDVMDGRKILLVNLAKGRLGDINSHLIGLILVGKIFMAALSRVDALYTRPPEFYLYIDEFQNVTTDSISAILSEARKYRLGLVLAHQFIAQIDPGIRDSVFGNVGSMAVFRVGAEDAGYIENQFEPTFTAADIIRIPNHNAYVKMLVNGFPAKPFNIQTQMPSSGDPLVGQQVKELSRMTFGKDRTEVEAMIAQKYANQKDESTTPRQPIQRSALAARPYIPIPRSAASKPLPQASPSNIAPSDTPEPISAPEPAPAPVATPPVAQGVREEDRIRLEPHRTAAPVRTDPFPATPKTQAHPVVPHDTGVSIDHVQDKGQPPTSHTSDTTKVVGVPHQIPPVPHKQPDLTTENDIKQNEIPVKAESTFDDLLLQEDGKDVGDTDSLPKTAPTTEPVQKVDPYREPPV
jgi:hypothetical protein